MGVARLDPQGRVGRRRRGSRASQRSVHRYVNPMTASLRPWGACTKYPGGCQREASGTHFPVVDAQGFARPCGCAIRMVELQDFPFLTAAVGG
jgi:hypothetical protein